jgi:protein-arginine kinase
MGAALGLVEGQTPQTLSATMLAAQAAHLVLGRGAGTDPRSLAVERARLFRETFTA